MAESNDTQNKTAEKTWKRRGLFAAAAALFAGVVARVSEQRVEAGTDGDVVLGTTNISPFGTAVWCSTAGATALVAQCTAGAGSTGFEGAGSTTGVLGFAVPSTTDPNSAGVYGVAWTGAYSGVWGLDSNSSAIGSAGVRGQSTTGLGVFGQIPSSSSANTIAIYAQNYSTYAGPFAGAGGFAIYGLCAKGHGLVGATAAAGAAAVVGASNDVAGAYAAAFFGPVVVSGAFIVVGGPKSAAVPHPDGTHRRLYCMESPESWFEDFGKGQLACGQADVTIDPDFAAVVDTDDYHVFLTDHSGQYLSVTQRTPKGFTVEADVQIARLKGTQESDLNGTFSWRVVAKRKDIPAPRFETVEIPPEPVLPNIPEPPAPSEPPRPRAAHRRG